MPAEATRGGGPLLIVVIGRLSLPREIKQWELKGTTELSY